MSILKRVAAIFAGALLLIMLGTGDGARAASRPTVADFMAKVGWTPPEIAIAGKGDWARHHWGRAAWVLPLAAGNNVSDAQWWGWG